MRSYGFDPTRGLRQTLNAQRTLRAVTDSTQAFRTVNDAMQPFRAWQEVVDRLGAARGVAEITEPWKPLRTALAFSDAYGSLGVQSDAFKAIRSALDVPVMEFRSLADVVGDLLDVEAQGAMNEVSHTVDIDGDSAAPSLLSELLLWLPHTAQVRLGIYALAALYAVMDTFAVEAGTERLDPHVTSLVYALTAIVVFLDAISR